MKNWLVAESTTLVRAMAIVPRLLESWFAASFLIGPSVRFCVNERSNPPPWIMKFGITR